MVGTGITALMFAVGKGMEEIAQLLIDNGADINLQNIDDKQGKSGKLV